MGERSLSDQGGCQSYRAHPTPVRFWQPDRSKTLSLDSLVKAAKAPSDKPSQLRTLRLVSLVRTDSPAKGLPSFTMLRQPVKFRSLSACWPAKAP